MSNHITMGYGDILQELVATCLSLDIPTRVAGLAYADRVATIWLSDPMRIRTVKFSVNHRMDQMGFSAEIDVAYQSYFIGTGMRDPATRRDDKGGIANVTGALQNLEASKEWLDRMR